MHKTREALLCVTLPILKKNLKGADLLLLSKYPIASYLKDGEPDYPRRLVGRCHESPREHVFSFDRVTRRGCVLRAK